MSIDPPRPALWRRFVGQFEPEQWILLCIFLGFVFLYAGYQDRSLDRVPIASMPVGRPLVVTFQTPKARTVVRTTVGVFVVRGAFPAVWGHPLVLDIRASGPHALCDRALAYCAKLY